MKDKILLLAGVFTSVTMGSPTENLVDCRYIPSGTRECNNYPTKFMYVKELATGKQIDFQQQHKLVVSKAVPEIQKPKIVKVISVDDMVDEDREFYEPSRFYQSRTNTPIEFAPYVVDESDENITLAQTDETNETNETSVQNEEFVEVKKEIIYPKYNVQEGDTLSQIANIFGVNKSEILVLNKIYGKGKIIRIGQRLKIPLTKKQYTKTLKKYKLQQRKKQLAKQARLAQQNKKYNKYDTKLLSPIGGTKSLRVQTTAYTSHRNQTDSTPFIAAWGNRIGPGMKIIAVSRDLIYKYGLRNGKKVKIQGLPGLYMVRDKMNPRYKKRIDIYMGVNRKKALRWGRRRTVIYW